MAISECVLREVIDQLDAISNWSNPERITSFAVSHEDYAVGALVTRDDNGEWELEEVS